MEADTQTTSATGMVVPVDFDLDDATRDDDWVVVADDLAAPADEVG
ncbi:hypothetical protein [uncultured Pseudokineococcus sp.]|nr:hypothetical protein [uncultured Pseudokineococcus sp.]